MRKENELDYLEKYIPSLAENALHKAYVDVLSHGSSVLEANDGKLVEVFPDGTRKTIKNIEADVKLKSRRMVVK